MPTRQAGRLAKKPATCSRRSCLRTTTCPRSSTPWTWNMFFAKSKPIVVTFMWTPLSYQVVPDTSTLAHRCRYGCGRPSHWCRAYSSHRAKRWSRPRARVASCMPGVAILATCPRLSAKACLSGVFLTCSGWRKPARIQEATSAHDLFHFLNRPQIDRYHILDRFRRDVQLTQTRQGLARHVVRFEKVNLAGG